MIALGLLTPQNIAAEKAKFLNDGQYNPQFVYANQIPIKELISWGQPKPKLVKHAYEMMELAPARKSKYIPAERTYIQQKISAFNLQYHLDPPLALEFSDNIIPRCDITRKRIIIQEPIRFSQDRFDDLYRHELETHLLRILNHEQNFPNLTQPETIEFRQTEEGLAGLHSYLFREQKILKKSYQTYIAVSIAQQGSFRDVFQAMIKLGCSLDLAWSLALRTKRGIMDTSMPGGLTKDICYLEGAIMMAHWILQPNQDLRWLYLGRLALSQISQYTSAYDPNQIMTPAFFQPREQYVQLIAEISQINNFVKIYDQTKS